MDKEALTRDRIGTEPYDIPGVGTVTLRGLNRFHARKVSDTKGAAQDHIILRHGVVDPVLTDADIDDWMAAAPAGEIENVTARISVLSGLSAGSDKEAYKSAGS